MSTRCNVHFNYGKEVCANIYRHSDGYPSAVLPDLQDFFAAVEAQTDDTRFDDPTYLAAKFVVWQAERNSRGRGNLNFLGVGIMLEDASDGEYVYTVDCKAYESNDYPVVTHTPEEEEAYTYAVKVAETQ